MLHKVIDKVKAINEIGKRKLRSGALLQELAKETDADIQKMLRVLHYFSHQHNWTAAETAAFEKVNRLREKYLSSREVITIKDFGAGKAGVARTPEQMREGVATKRAVAQVCKTASSPDQWGRLIFTMIRIFQPASCLELGTCLGISAAYQLLALQLNNKGRLVTLEGAPALADLADIHLKELQYENYTVKAGRFADTLPAVLAGEQPIDFAFIDGHHDKQATGEYFEMLYPALSTHSILIFDDINWSQGMREIWEQIYHDKRIKLSFDLYKWGVCFIDKELSRNDLKHFVTAI